MKNQNASDLFIFTALECEARPLIQFFGLKKQTRHHAFVIYQKDKIVLTITGIGKTAMAGAVAYTLAMISHKKMPVLINLGIAGHRTLSVGSLCFAIKIIDSDSGKRFYPQFLDKNAQEMGVVKTVSVPSTQYHSDDIYDMEAAAFYEMALRFSTCELIHCIKVISDNEQTPLDSIKPKKVSQWITNKMTIVESLLSRLREQQQSLGVVELDEYNDIFDTLHFTVSGKIKLKGLLLRWKVLTDDAKISINLDDVSSGKEVIQQVEMKLNCLDLHL